MTSREEEIRLGQTLALLWPVEVHFFRVFGGFQILFSSKIEGGFPMRGAPQFCKTPLNFREKTLNFGKPPRRGLML